MRALVFTSFCVLFAFGGFCVERRAFVERLFDRTALKRAVTMYAQSRPELFPDKAALLAEIDAVKGAYAIDRLMTKVFFRLPELASIDEILAVRRHGSATAGLPSNWQGNTSVPVTGYSNGVVRITLNPRKRSVFDKPVYFSTNFVGDLDLDFDARHVAFSTRSAKTGGWCVAELSLVGDAPLRELSPTDTPHVHYYNPLYLPNGQMIFIGTAGFQGVPCVGGSDNVGSLMLRYEDGHLRRLTFDQDENWYPTLTDQGRVLFLRWEYADSAHYFSRLLMTMNPDGSDQQEFYGSNSYWPNSLFYARTDPRAQLSDAFHVVTRVAV